MPAPTFNLAVTGTAPNQLATEAGLEAELNRTLSETWDGFTANDSAVLRDAGVVTLTNVTGSGNAITAEFPAALVPMIGATIPNRLFVGFVSPVTTTGSATLAIGADVVELRQAGGLPLTEAINLTAGEFIVFERWGGAWRLRFGDASLPRVTRMVGDEAAARLELADRVDTTEAAQVTLTDAVAEKADGGAMFHRADDEQVPISVSDDNQVLLGLDQFAEPLAPFASSRSLDRKADAGAGFYTGETDSINPVFTMGDNGRQVVGIVSDADGNLGFPWRLTFYVGDSDFEFAKIDETGVVLEGWDEAFRRIYPAGGDEVDFSNLPISARSAADSQPWNDRWSIRVKRPLGDPYTVPVDAMFPTHRAIYDRCDALVAEYSDYITRTVIGQSVGGNDIVMYRATPPNYVRISGLTLAPPVRPKIILLGSTHSNEKHCVMANTAFFEGLVRDWRTREHLSELRWGCDLIYVPCVNPDGFDRNIRRNGNNVDINRNYPERWSSASAGERGPSPASEPETQAIVGLFQAHPDAIAAIDHHRMFRIATGPDAGAERFLWIAAEGAPQLNIARNSVDQVMADVRRTFPFVDNGNAVTGTVTNHYGGACGLYAQSLGIPGFLFETPEDVGTGMMNTDVVYYAEQALITFIANLHRRERRRIEDQ